MLLVPPQAAEPRKKRKRCPPTELKSIASKDWPSLYAPLKNQICPRKLDQASLD